MKKTIKRGDLNNQRFERGCMVLNPMEEIAEQGIIEVLFCIFQSVEKDGDAA